MPETSRTTNRTTKGEGSRSTSAQVALEKATRLTTSGERFSKEDIGEAVSLSTETPGDSTSTSTDNLPARKSTQTKPTVTSRRTEAPAIVRTISAPAESRKTEREDIGIKVTFKFRLTSL